MKKISRKDKQQIKYVIVAFLSTVFVCLMIVLLNLNINHTIPLNFEGDKLSGIDVSYHNGNIDWSKIKDNIDFAFIRVGYRGYTEGAINKDKNAEKNLKHANKNKIPIGVYFYSQATNEEEAIEEAKFVLDMVKWHDISLPIIIDYEYPQDNNGNKIGRLYEANLTNAQRTNIINAFCKTIKDAGYQYGVYASANIYSYQLNADDFIDDTLIWVAQYSDNLKYTKDVDIWQYSKTGKIDGIGSTNVDLNYWFKNE